MEISLIISTYNRKNLILPLLLKLNQQTMKDFEVIVADDGSSDGTVNEIKSMVDKLVYQFQLITQKDRGFRVAKSRNNGARMAQANQLVFLDDDCWPEDNYLSCYHAAFSPDHLLKGDIIFVPSFDKLDQVISVHYADPNVGLWGANFSIAQKLFWQISGYNEDFMNQSGEDGDLQLRLWEMGITTISVQGAHVYHLNLPKAGKGWF